MSLTSINYLAPSGIPEVCAGDSLATHIIAAFLAEGITFQSGDILVVAQKIVSKSEGRTRRLRDVVPTPRAIDLAAVTGKDPRYVEVVLQESREVVRVGPGVLIVEDRRGFILANAGVDASNVQRDELDGTILLLPRAPDESAYQLRIDLQRYCGQSLGVIINDSWGRAWRRGTVGTALGVSGIPALLDLRGQADRFGRHLMTTEVGLADEIAAGASALMGQADEGRPVVLVRGVQVPLDDGTGNDLLRPRESDLFR